MILNSDDSNTKRWLVNLILAALLVNFSLYITKFIVDFTNILATQIANTFPTDVNGLIDVSGAFMNSLGITGLLSAGDLNNRLVDAGGAWGYIFGTMVLFIVMIFVFAAGGLMLLIRYAALCLYMVLSPLMFLGWVFPQLQSTTSKYWSGFLGRAFFAPIYLLLIYFSWYVVTALYAANKSLGKSPDFQAVLAVSGQKVADSFGATFPPFILSCIFLIASIVIASKLGADGAGAAMNYGKSASNWTKRKVQGAAWGAARATGRTAAYLPATAARRGTYALGNKLGQQIDRMQEKDGRLGALARSSIVNDFTRNQSTKLQNAKFGLATTVGEDEKKRAAIEIATNERVEKNEIKQRITEAKEAEATASAKANDKTLSAAEREKAAKERDAHKATLSTNIPKLTADELLSMSTAELNHPELQDMAAYMTNKQIEDLEKSGKLSALGKDSTMGKIKENRNQDTFDDYLNDLGDLSNSTTQLEGALKGLADTVKNLSNDRLQALDKSKLTDERIAMNLSSKQLDTLRDSGKFGVDELNEIKAARTRGLTAIANGTHTSNLNQDPTGARRSLIGSGGGTMPVNPEFGKMIVRSQQNLMTKSVSDAAELPVEIFLASDMAKFITPEILEQRMRNGSVTEAQKTTIENNIKAHLASSNATSSDRNKWTKWTEKSTIGASFDFSTPVVNPSTGTNQPQSWPTLPTT